MQLILVQKIKQRVRAITALADEEINDLIEAARRELEIAGVYGNEKDPLYFQALVLYCKANYGYDENTERFKESFESLKNSMALSGDYSKKEGVENDSDTVVG